jgi:hypothetical protein
MQFRWQQATVLEPMQALKLKQWQVLAMVWCEQAQPALRELHEPAR